MKTLVCSAFPFGYGPAAKLLLIAERVRTMGLRTVFLGTGIAHELAVRSSAFDNVVEASPGDAIARSVIDCCDGLLSLQDRAYARLALGLSKPLYVADSLFWMRDRIPAPFLSARRYWVQKFTGVRQPNQRVWPKPVVVGPIIRSMSPTPESLRTRRLVVNLGGCESPHDSMLEDTSYFDFVMAGLLRSDLVARQRHDVVLMAGSRCIQLLRTRYPRCGIEFVSVAHEEATSLLQMARMVLTSPGLTASLECFQLAVPTFFLPPQNFSQWWILKTLRENGLALGSFHWEDVLPGYPIKKRMSESTRAPLVRQAIRSVAQDRDAARRYRDCLSSCVSHDHPDLVRRQRAYFDALGPNGTEQIVRNLAELC